MNTNNPINGHAIDAAVAQAKAKEKYERKVAFESAKLIGVFSKVCRGYLFDAIALAMARAMAAMIHNAFHGDEDKILRCTGAFIKMFSEAVNTHGQATPMPAANDKTPSVIITQ